MLKTYRRDTIDAGDFVAIDGIPLGRVWSIDGDEAQVIVEATGYTHLVPLADLEYAGLANPSSAAAVDAA